MQVIKDCLEIITMCCFIYFLYTKTRRPKLKIVKEVQKPKKKRRYKYLRRFRIPYVGKTEIIQFDQKHGYIESVWNEIQKPKKR